MRPLKFRAWDSRNKKWLWPYPEGFNILVEVTAFQIIQQVDTGRLNDIDIVQFTGFRDGTKWTELTEEERIKWVRDGNMPSQWKGKDIYEGDIVETYNKYHWDKSNPKIYTEKWYKNLIKFEKLDSAGFPIMGFIFPDESNKLKIIGNKFENPELLK